jgi:hypothetical protein
VIGEELKPCPFCDTKPVGPEPADSGWWIECERCEIIMDRDSRRDLIKAWNTRVNPFENPGHDVEDFYQDGPETITETPKTSTGTSETALQRH